MEAIEKDMSIYIDCSLKYKTPEGIKVMTGHIKDNFGQRVKLTQGKNDVYWNVNDNRALPILLPLRHCTEEYLKNTEEDFSDSAINVFLEAIKIQPIGEYQFWGFLNSLYYKEVQTIIKFWAKHHFDIYNLIAEGKAIEKQLHETSNAIQQNILSEIRTERMRQDEEHGINYYDCVLDLSSVQLQKAYSIPEVSQMEFNVDSAIMGGTLTWAHIALKKLVQSINIKETQKRRNALIKLSALCVAWIESIDNKKQMEDGKNN